MITTTPLAGRAASDADYERLELSRDTIAPWEDGARTDGGRGTFEWWYFDAHLDDGTALVVVFQTKDFTDPQKPLTPLVRINLDLADGRSPPSLLPAAIDEVSVDVTLTGQVPSWRPGTGRVYFGADQSHEFAWLPAVPQGTVEVRYRIGDETHE